MTALHLLGWWVVLRLLRRSTATTPEADIEIYKAVREHERELNKATAVFEHSMLAPLTLLNGGAIVALTTVLGAASLDLDVRVVLASIGLWSAGLFAVVVATYSGYRAQQWFARAERGRRQDTESAIGRRTT